MSTLMRLLTITTALFQLVAGPATAQQRRPSPDPQANARVTAEARQYLDDCTKSPADARSLCRDQQAQFLTDYMAARGGSLDDQKNMAFCFHGGCDGAVRKDELQACAWTLVLLNSGHPEVTRLDATRTEWTCDKLSAAERSVATARASRLQREIREQPTRLPRAAEGPMPPPECLDSTAAPLGGPPPPPFQPPSRCARYFRR